MATLSLLIGREGGQKCVVVIVYVKCCLFVKKAYVFRNKRQWGIIVGSEDIWQGSTIWDILATSQFSEFYMK